MIACAFLAGCASELPHARDSELNRQRDFAGDPVAACGYPSVVRVADGCTGTLVHPQVVVTAGRCRTEMSLAAGGYRGEATFGGLGELRDDVGMTCELVPQKGVIRSDVMFCRLDREVPYPVTPIAFGCEVEAEVVVGGRVTLVGHGITRPSERRPVGPKRWISAQIRSLVVDVDEVGAVVRDGEPGVMLLDRDGGCAGDAGSPAFARMDDGTLRLLATSSGGRCTGFATLTHAHIPWFEARTGIDLTPCHNEHGGWSPTPECGGFYAGTDVGGGDPLRFCADEPHGEASETCGAAYGDEPIQEPFTTFEDGGELDAGEMRRYRPWAAKPGSTVRVVLTGSGDPDLYVRLGAQPDFTAFDCRPYLSEAEEICELTVGAEGTVFVAVHAYRATNFELVAEWVAR